MTKPCLLLTNDDGIEAVGLHALIRALHERDFPIVVIAPATEQSATSMRLSLGSNLKFEEREDIANSCLLYTSPSPRDVEESRMPSSA